MNHVRLLYDRTRFPVRTLIDLPRVYDIGPNQYAVHSGQVVFRRESRRDDFNVC